jgi:hypothetical protein
LIVIAIGWSVSRRSDVSCQNLDTPSEKPGLRATLDRAQAARNSEFLAASQPPGRFSRLFPDHHNFEPQLLAVLAAVDRNAQ